HQPTGFQRFTAAFAADERDSPEATALLAGVAHDATESMIARASALARLAGRPGPIAIAEVRAATGDTNALVRRSALEILETAPAEERLRLAVGLLGDPSRAVRLEAAWVLAPVSATLRPEDRSAF